jgi:hypothetical protein
MCIYLCSRVVGGFVPEFRLFDHFQFQYSLDFKWDTSARVPRCLYTGSYCSAVGKRTVRLVKQLLDAIDEGLHGERLHEVLRAGLA